MLDPADVRRFIAEGGQVLRTGERLIILGGTLDGDALAEEVLPKITAEDAAVVREILAFRTRTVYFINTEIAAERAVRTLIATPKKILGLDTETTPLAKHRAPYPVTFTLKGELCKRQLKDGTAGAALDPYRSEVRLLQLFGRREDGVFVFDMTKVSWATLKPLLESTKLIAANATFDVTRLLQHDIEPKSIGDPFHLASLAFGLIPGSAKLSLAILAKKTLRLTIPKFLAQSDWNAAELRPEQIDYAALDAVLALDVYTMLMLRLSPKQHRVRALIERAIVATARMELAGMPFDAERHGSMITEWKTQLPLAEAAMIVAAKGRDLRRANELQEHLALHVTGERLETWPKTSTKRLVSRKIVLLANNDLPALAELRAFRKLDKFVAAFGETLARRINPETGRLHGRFVLGGTRTGRYACHSPNIQQAPKKERAFRSVFRPSCGWKIATLDFSQIELRIAGQLITELQGSPSTFDRIFAKGDVDVHEETARLLYNVVPDAPVREEWRDNGKTTNFSLLFGAGEIAFHARRVAENPRVLREESNALRDRWRTALPDVVAWQTNYAWKSRRQGFTETVLGRRWYWKWNIGRVDKDAPPEDRIQDDGFRYCTSLNYPVQGSGAELLQLAIARIDRALIALRAGARLVAVVHDELVFETPESEAEALVTLARNEMTAAWRALFPGAAKEGLVSVRCGNCWGNE